jgi:hypothetical protein
MTIDISGRFLCRVGSAGTCPRTPCGHGRRLPGTIHNRLEGVGCPSSRGRLDDPAGPEHHRLGVHIGQRRSRATRCCARHLARWRCRAASWRRQTRTSTPLRRASPRRRPGWRPSGCTWNSCEPTGPRIGTRGGGSSRCVTSRWCPACRYRSLAATWVPVDRILKRRKSLAFDHAKIVTDAVERARSKLEYTDLATAFCAPVFTVTELRNVYEIVWGQQLDPRNFHRKVSSVENFLEPTGQQTTKNGGRPAMLYRRGSAAMLYPPILRG